MYVCLCARTREEYMLPGIERDPATVFFPHFHLEKRGLPYLDAFQVHRPSMVSNHTWQFLAGESPSLFLVIAVHLSTEISNLSLGPKSSCVNRHGICLLGLGAPYHTRAHAKFIESTMFTTSPPPVPHPPLASLNDTCSKLSQELTS